MIVSLTLPFVAAVVLIAREPPSAVAAITNDERAEMNFFMTT